MSRSERRKGIDAERELVRLLVERGVNAQRVPLSGSLAGYKGDLHTDLPSKGVRWEVKRRASLKTLYDWLGDNDVLAVRQDGDEWLVVLRLDTLLSSRP